MALSGGFFGTRTLEYPGEDVSEDERMDPLPALLQKHLDRCDELTPEVLQSLSTHQLDENVATDASLDIFTGARQCAIHG